MHLRNHTTSYKIYETQDLLQKVGFVSISEKDLKLFILQKYPMIIRVVYKLKRPYLQ